ncbi:MAG TPA: threonine ammonia-lyase IlvA [Frankiaceae bacterium]|jgi:threonine dehydratase|nr:threonine ammonia-lyase IlvA [Frankiaceae bacterium]
MSGSRVTAADVDAAAERLSEVVAASPLQRNARLSAATGAEVYLKREDLQPVRSYKVRGAYNLMAQLPAEQRAAGVVCASAGNHAQGVALSCQLLGIRGTVYLPRTTPRQKRDRIAELGRGQLTIELVGDTYDDASLEAVAYAASTDAVLIPAFDDPRTIAGQGTVVSELTAQLGSLPDVLVLPVGGGGLLAGAVAWLSGQAAKPRLIGAEPAGAPSMTAALGSGHPVALEHIDSFVDGAAVQRVGEHTFATVRESGVEMRSVAEGRVCSEMLELYQVDGIISEPAGALASAALDQLGTLEGARVVCVLSGGNNDVSRYPEVVERSLVFEGLKHYFLISFPQEPGALRRFLDHALGPDDDITLFEYVKRSNRETGPALVGIELARRSDLEPLLTRLAELPLSVDRITPEQAAFRFLV